MKIDSYSIGMDSARTFSSSSTRKLAIGITRQNFEGSLTNMTDAFANADGTNVGADNENSQDKTSDSSTSLNDMISSMRSPLSNKVRELNTGSQLRQIENVHHKFVVYLWRLLFGREKSDELAKEFGWGNDNVNNDVTSNMQTVIKIQGFSESYYEENETMSFNSMGSVTTEDGRIINFNLEVEMSRSFSQYVKENSLAIGNMVDPLVINFDGNPSELTDTKFFFDLDNDGTEEEVSSLTSGSGFLALDKNNDGIINNGSELFGTSSGDGFADLAKYDNDNNGWIDENDDIFEKLQIWVKDNSGYDKLYSLKEKNIGAIYLGNADTDFTLRSINTGEVNGAIRKTGIFLYEDGTGVGTVNHLDIAN